VERSLTYLCFSGKEPGLRKLTLMVNSRHLEIFLFTLFHSAIEKVTIALHIDANYSLILIKVRFVGLLFYKIE
jgi:sugar fermentation stimulation protein A